MTRALSELFSEKANYTLNNPQFNDLISLLNTATISQAASAVSQVIFTEEIIYDELISLESKLAFSKKLKRKVLKSLSFKLISLHYELT